MIYLLGGSGYVGQAYQALLSRKGIAFKNVQRAELDYGDTAALLAALRADRPEFLNDAATAYLVEPKVNASQLEAGQFERVIENHQGLTISCLEETACRQGLINLGSIDTAIKRLGKSNYGTT